MSLSCHFQDYLTRLSWIVILMSLWRHFHVIFLVDLIKFKYLDVIIVSFSRFEPNWVILMSLWRHFHVILSWFDQNEVFGCHYRVIFKTIWCHYDVIMMSLWCHFQDYLTRFSRIESFWCHYRVIFTSFLVTWLSSWFIQLVLKS